jgi:hypothetical protein
LGAGVLPSRDGHDVEIMGRRPPGSIMRTAIRAMISLTETLKLAKIEDKD